MGMKALSLVWGTNFSATSHKVFILLKYMTGLHSFKDTDRMLEDTNHANIDGLSCLLLEILKNVCLFSVFLLQLRLFEIKLI